VLAEFGDDPTRYATAKARKNYAGTSPITRRSGRTKLVAARYIHNDRLIDALMTQGAAGVRGLPARPWRRPPRDRPVRPHSTAIGSAP
jgi:hypothetical protein